MTNKFALPATLEWDDVDERAVDTARVLAMDAVQKVGNGHPGTAMSLAPVAYLLFQKVMRHDPADPEWIARAFADSLGGSREDWAMGAAIPTVRSHERVGVVLEASFPEGRDVQVEMIPR